MHRIYTEEALETALGDQPAGEPAGRIVITGDEARHAAKVKRVDVGEMVEILDGRGTVARGTVARAGPDTGGAGAGRGRGEWVVEVAVSSVTPSARVRPRVEVWSATPKGGRVDELIDGLSQVGASGWTPLATERGVVSPRETKLGRLERVAWEAAKQSGRPWVLEVGQERPFEGALRGGAGVSVVLADGTGSPYAPTGAAAVRVLIGPEGGWSESEMRLAREVGVATARFGPHVMRIETAAVVAAAVVLDQEARHVPLPADEGEE